jgi:hypothetical protein
MRHFAVLDPSFKLKYFKEYWDSEWVAQGEAQLRKVVRYLLISLLHA